MVRAASLLSAAAVLALAAAARPAHANGVNIHSWITLRAVELLPEGQLRRILSDPAMEPYLVNGSIFPDGGYAVNDGYGELTHWEPFVTAYIAWMRAELGPPYDRPEARKHLGFLMGVASHGMEDQVFDSSYMAAARRFDAVGWSDVLFEDFDTATDVLLVAATGADFRGREVWVPAEEAAGVLAGIGHPVAPSVLLEAQGAMHTFVLAYGSINGRNPAEVERYTAQYPWGAAHIMDEHEPGSPPTEAEVVSAYQQVIWDRLHDASGVQNQIIATYPSAGSDGHPTDRTRIDAQVQLYFGHGVYGQELYDKLAITDATGKAYHLGIQAWSGTVGNLIRLVPEEDWAPDQTFTVTVAPGVRTIDGLTYDQPWSFQFSTRAATGPRDPMSDPTPHQGEPWVPEAPDDGGCSAGGGAGSLVGLAALALLGRRRRVRA